MYSSPHPHPHTHTSINAFVKFLEQRFYPYELSCCSWYNSIFNFPRATSNANLLFGRPSDWIHFKKDNMHWCKGPVISISGPISIKEGMQLNGRLTTNKKTVIYGSIEISNNVFHNNPMIFVHKIELDDERKKLYILSLEINIEDFQQQGDIQLDYKVSFSEETHWGCSSHWWAHMLDILHLFFLFFFNVKYHVCISVEE